MRTYELPGELGKDINDISELIEKYKKGEISATELKARRVPSGVYEQREKNTYMVRVRCAAGIITPRQLAGIARISQRHGGENIHLTTRQEAQIHGVGLDDITAIMNELQQLGMASRGGGGNTVRNITAQEDSGINLDDVFDVTPYAVALTSRLIGERDSWNLPRKFKIAFSASSADKGYATISDLGFIAKIKDGKKGFAVYAGGGMGMKPRTAMPVYSFLPEGQVYSAARAVKTLFWKNGNRKNKHAARLRFLREKWGDDEFFEKLDEEFCLVKSEGHIPLKIEEPENARPSVTLSVKEITDISGFALWKERFAREQKQTGLFSVLASVELGFIGNEQAEHLAETIGYFGDDVIRLTKDQNFLLRNIPESHLGNVYDLLKNDIGIECRPVVLDRIISCAGAATCQLGICLSRGAARTIIEGLSASGLDLDALRDLKINISGCLNSCGQHPAADLGFSGKAGRKGGRLYPAYNVLTGGVISEGKTKFAERKGEIAAKDMAGFVSDLLGKYLSVKSGYKDFHEYAKKRGEEDIAGILKKYERIPDFEEESAYYRDLGSDEEFSIASRGTGECSAGIFDLIEMDLKNMDEAEKRMTDLFGGDYSGRGEAVEHLVYYSARALLVTRGAEPKHREGVYDAFREHFIDTGLAAGRFLDLIISARNLDLGVLKGKSELAREFAKHARTLYDNMDNAFNFSMKGHRADDENGKPTIVKDLRGVACPMNFVKTKMELAALKPGDKLEIWLDDGEPIDNVPGSVRGEGHIVEEPKDLGGYWSVIIRKR